MENNTTNLFYNNWGKVSTCDEEYYFGSTICLSSLNILHAENERFTVIYA